MHIWYSCFYFPVSPYGWNSSIFSLSSVGAMVTTKRGPKQASKQSVRWKDNCVSFLLCLNYRNMLTIDDRKPKSQALSHKLVWLSQHNAFLTWFTYFYWTNDLPPRKQRRQFKFSLNINAYRESSDQDMLGWERNEITHRSRMSIGRDFMKLCPTADLSNCKISACL